MATKPVPTEGRIVHFKARPDSACQAAIVVRAWGSTPDSAVNLQVFRDGSNDLRHDGIGGDLTTWVTSAGFAPSGSAEDQGTGRRWHWPEFVAPVEV